MYTSNYTGAEIDDGIRPYKVYTAILTQADTDAPAAVVLENTLGGAVVWTRNAVGQYFGTLADAFTLNKTFCILQDYAWDGEVGNTLTPFSVNRIDLVIVAGDGFLVAGNPAFIEIRVYP